MKATVNVGCLVAIIVFLVAAILALAGHWLAAVIVLGMYALLLLIAVTSD